MPQQTVKCAKASDPRPFRQNTLTAAPAGPGDPGVPGSPRGPWAPSGPRAPVGPASPWKEAGKDAVRTGQGDTDPVDKLHTHTKKGSYEGCLAEPADLMTFHLPRSTLHPPSLVATRSRHTGSCYRLGFVLVPSALIRKA